MRYLGCLSAAPVGASPLAAAHPRNPKQPPLVLALWQAAEDAQAAAGQHGVAGL